MMSRYACSIIGLIGFHGLTLKQHLVDTDNSLNAG
jgi:hypothetical protein